MQKRNFLQLPCISIIQNKDGKMKKELQDFIQNFYLAVEKNITAKVQRNAKGKFMLGGSWRAWRFEIHFTCQSFVSVVKQQNILFTRFIE